MITDLGLGDSVPWPKALVPVSRTRRKTPAWPSGRVGGEVVVAALLLRQPDNSCACPSPRLLGHLSWPPEHRYHRQKSRKTSDGRQSSGRRWLGSSTSSKQVGRNREGAKRKGLGRWGFLKLNCAKLASETPIFDFRNEIYGIFYSIFDRRNPNTQHFVTHF